MPNLVEKKKIDILSNEEVLLELVASGKNLCFGKDLRDKLDFFFESYKDADICGYKIVKLTLTEDMKQLMGELAISICLKLKDPMLNDHIDVICNNEKKELKLRVAFNNFFTAIGEENKILLVLTNFYEHFSHIKQADVSRLLAFLSTCKSCRLWICGVGEWYQGKHSIYQELYRRLDPMYAPYFDAIKKGGDSLPSIFLINGKDCRWMLSILYVTCLSGSRSFTSETKKIAGMVIVSPCLWMK